MQFFSLKEGGKLGVKFEFPTILTLYICIHRLLVFTGCNRVNNCLNIFI